MSEKTEAFTPSEGFGKVQKKSQLVFSRDFFKLLVIGLKIHFRQAFVIVVTPFGIFLGQFKHGFS